MSGLDRLEGRVAVVTGGASGIGRALAERFASEGMQIVIADVEAGALDAAAADMGDDVLAVRTDVSDADAVEALADAAYDRFGAVHVVCNNAGVVSRGAAWAQSLDEWRWVLGVDLWGPINGVRSFVSRMVASGEPGHVVNTASIAGLLPFASIAPYDVAKSGVVALSEALHHDLEAAGAPIGVSVLCPGVVPTRIAESSRNKPGAPPTESMVVPTQLSPPPTALSVGEVADQVVDAIRTGRFWIVTHEAYREWITRRAEGILDGATVIQPPTL